LIAKEIRLGFVESHSQHPGLSYIPLIKDELVAIAHVNSKHFSLDRISAKRITELPIVIRETGSGTREVFESYLDNWGISVQSLQIAMQLGSTESIKSFLKNSDAIGIVSIRAVKDELESGTLKIIPFEGGQIDRWFHLVHLVGQPDNLSSHFIQFLDTYYNL